MTSLLTSTLSSSIGRFCFGLGLWLMVLIGAMSMVACAPIKGVPVQMVAQPVMVEPESEEVVLLGALPQSSKAEKGGFQKASLAPTSPRFGSVSVTITEEFQDVAVRKYCETAWEGGMAFEDYTSTVRGRESELHLSSEIRYLTSKYEEIILAPRLENGKLTVVETLPSGTVLVLDVPKSSAKEMKGAKYLGDVRIAKVSQDWYVVIATTSKGTHAQCMSTPGYGIIR